MGDAGRELGRITATGGGGNQRRRSVPERGRAELRRTAAGPRGAGRTKRHRPPDRDPPPELPDQLGCRRRSRVAGWVDVRVARPAAAVTPRGRGWTVSARSLQSTQGMPFWAVTAPPCGPVVGITTDGVRGGLGVLTAGGVVFCALAPAPGGRSTKAAAPHGLAPAAAPTNNPDVLAFAPAP